MNQQRIGVIADTHGLLRPEAIEALRGSDLIIHAGDIGKPQVLEILKNIAPVVAIRGNIDKGTWCQSLSLSEVIQFGQKWLYVIHELSELDLDPSASGFDAVIFGHSHQPSIETRNGVVFLNPGSAGPRRFKLPISLAIIDMKANVLKPQLIELAIKS